MCSYDSCSDASAVVETSGQYQQYLSDCFARTSGVHRACLLQQTTPVAWASARASPALHTRTPQRFFGDAARQERLITDVRGFLRRSLQEGTPVSCLSHPLCFKYCLFLPPVSLRQRLAPGPPSTSSVTVRHDNTRQLTPKACPRDHRAPAR